MCEIPEREHQRKGLGLRGKSGSDQRSFAFAQAFARWTAFGQRWGLTAPERTGANAAPNRQAGDHWFEPSTAHRKPARPRDPAVSDSQHTTATSTRAAALCTCC
jgi:hypothetical protein